MSERQTVDQLLRKLGLVSAAWSLRLPWRPRRKGAILIDLRRGDQRREGGIIPGSVHIPLSVVFWRLDPTSGYDDPRLSDPTRQFVLLCADGYSSSLAAATLQDLGFAHVTDVVGGFAAWAAAGLPLEPVPD